MVDSGCFKTKLKGEKQRSDEGTYEDQTREKRRTDGEKKYGRHTSSIFDSKGVGCAKYRESVYNP